MISNEERREVASKLRSLCGVSDGVKYNSFDEYSINRGRVAEECDKIDAKFEKLEKDKLDADIEYEHLKKVCAQILGQEECEGLTSEEMVTLATVELEKRLMPDGYEWPRYEDGKPVRIGGNAVIVGADCAVRSIGFADHRWIIAGGGGHEKIGYGECVKRPAPKVIAADGKPLEVGQTVWCLHEDKPREWTVIDLHDVYYGSTGVLVGRDDETAHTAPSNLTHERPVLDADGKPIHEGDTVWCIATDDELKEIGIVIGKNDVRGTLTVKSFSFNNGKTWANFNETLYTVKTCYLTHKEPDSWERIEEDARKMVDDGLHDNDEWVIDIVGRCKKLAGVE